MSSVVIDFPGKLALAPAPAAVLARPDPSRAAGGGAGGREDGFRLLRRRATVQARIDGMRARGMSDTGIRRALGLSEPQAVEAGIIPSRANEVANGASPNAKAAAAGAEGRAGGTGGEARGPGGPLMAKVLEAVAQAGGVRRDEIAGPSQGRRLTPLRQLTMYLVRELCVGASLPAIGHFLDRDHTTVHYGCRMAERRLATDPHFRRLHDAVRGALAQTEGPADG